MWELYVAGAGNLDFQLILGKAFCASKSIGPEVFKYFRVFELPSITYWVGLIRVPSCMRIANRPLLDLIERSGNRFSSIVISRKRFVHAYI